MTRANFFFGASIVLALVAIDDRWALGPAVFALAMGEIEFRKSDR